MTGFFSRILIPEYEFLIFHIILHDDSFIIFCDTCNLLAQIQQVLISINQVAFRKQAIN